MGPTCLAREHIASLRSAFEFFLKFRATIFLVFSANDYRAPQRLGPVLELQVFGGRPLPKGGSTRFPSRRLQIKPTDRAFRKS
jgi:hypothetical protein